MDGEIEFTGRRARVEDWMEDSAVWRRLDTT